MTTEITEKWKESAVEVKSSSSEAHVSSSVQTTADSWRPNRASDMDHAFSCEDLSGTFRDSAGDSDYLRSLFKHCMISGSGAQPCEAGNVTVSQQTSLQLLSERPSTEACTLSGQCGFCIRAFCEIFQRFLFNTNSNIRNQPRSLRVYSPALGRQSSKPLLRS